MWKVFCEVLYLNSIDKTIKLFENGYHELQHDEEYKEMKLMMLDWCNDRIAKSKPFGIFNKLNYGLPAKQSSMIEKSLLFFSALIYLYFIYMQLLLIYFINRYGKKYKEFSLKKYPILPLIIWTSFLKKKFGINSTI